MKANNPAFYSPSAPSSCKDLAFKNLIDSKKLIIKLDAMIETHKELLKSKKLSVTPVRLAVLKTLDLHPHADADCFDLAA